jgi:hypothetical protein
MTSAAAKDAEQYWDSVTNQYEDSLALRMSKMYQDTSKEILAQFLKASVSGHPTTVGMDFAVGPGEPSRTFLFMYESLENSEKQEIGLQKWIAMDISSEFLAKAKLAIKVPKTVTLETLQFTPGFDFEAQLGPLDLIVCSLGLMYTEIEDGDQHRLLKQFSQALRARKGALVATVWPHPSKVPFLRIMKLVNSQFSGSQVTLKTLETTDGSFSLWNRDKVAAILHDSGFELEKWEEIDLPLSYPNFDSLIQFCRETEWYKNPVTRKEAIQKVKDDVSQELGCEVQDGPLTLDNKFALFVARPFV